MLPASRPASHRLIAGALILVTALIVIGQLVAVFGAFRSDSGAVPIPSHGSVSRRLDAVLIDALGPSDRGVRRFRLAPPVHHGNSYSVSIIWSLNNDVAEGTVGNGGAADVYNMLHDLAVSGIPISSVRLTGTYPVAGQERVVMQLAAGRKLLALLKSVGSDGLDPQSAWPLVDRMYVYPPVQPTGE